MSTPTTIGGRRLCPQIPPDSAPPTQEDDDLVELFCDEILYEFKIVSVIIYSSVAFSQLVYKERDLLIRRGGLSSASLVTWFLPRLLLSIFFLIGTPGRRMPAAWALDLGPSTILVPDEEKHTKKRKTKRHPNPKPLLKSRSRRRIWSPHFPPRRPEPSM